VFFAIDNPEQHFWGFQQSSEGGIGDLKLEMKMTYEWFEDLRV